MFDQEQEHWDYEMGANSDLQNAYDQSRMEADTVGDRDKITELLNQGKYVIVEYSPVYCQSTDAYIADRPHIIDSFDNKKEAKNEFYYLQANYDICEEAFVELLPRDIRPIITEVQIDDDIPF